ncbi:MAG: hypothetical protein ASARMPREDX12_006536 [Alectoria sarmentosa]|nr:MAG: hypothetical protein ASARMPREDX12_006536 [Alectoria sarmentosa]
MEPAPDLTLQGLTARLVESSKVISDCIAQNGLPEMSFDANGPAQFPVPPTLPEAHIARLRLLEAAMLLERLVRGPIEAANRVAAAHHDSASTRTLYRFDVFSAVPLEGEIAYAEIAKTVGLDESRTRRIMQYAMTNGFFAETKDGHVIHSAQSAAIARDEKLKAVIGHHVEDVYPAAGYPAARVTDQLSAQPIDDEEPTSSGFQLANKTDLTMFEYFEQVEPERAERFGLAMSSLSVPGGIFDGAHVLRAFDWAGLGVATVVDVGGGRGHISRLIAEANQDLSFIVQDYAKTLATGEEALPASLRSRFEFMPHDFFAPQPHLSSRGKVVFYIRLILHDWPNKYCIRILRNLIPALKDGSTILVNETVLPPVGAVNMALEKLGRMVDMQMLTCLNSRERTAQDYEELFTAADTRFKLANIHQSPGSPLAILEIRFSESK